MRLPSSVAAKVKQTKPEEAVYDVERTLFGLLERKSITVPEPTGNFFDGLVWVILVV
ncbi:hypothetical protein NEUTE1DRAFT_118882 [Neurospora tetrasperma FGSC 2508]|uniref:Uncharacterized protein n=1 Tax=Neurospora tetrasperma (strain FGSC 2508 / ATCC MYA-4615 / P0657) TaxID=510951 RepID=F8N4D4_NEUT8|nr:uncharacterized protein NEUTE1DRAFT_118882 [Neurospora tetrasperma FGSC 2508]EGO52675.1 hypothetical protein NEUTE1DRAFT_118882 [Neurospora tetrasperma FGSC 2508]